MKKTTLIGAMAAVSATASLIAIAPQAAADPQCGPDPTMTTAYYDTSWTSHNDGVWVVCVHHTSVTSNCYATGPVEKLYRRGEGPAPECHNIYNSPGLPR
jgi:hypothetical protein